jgi:hypothetical protein
MSPEAIGEVKQAVGVPRILRGSRYIELGPGTDILVRDVVINGVSDRVSIEMVDATRITLGVDSEFAFHVYSYEQPFPMARMSLSYGRLRIETGRFTRKDDHTFEVSTPSGEMDITGDIWAAYSMDDERLEAILLSDDRLAIHNQHGMAVTEDTATGLYAALGAAPYSGEGLSAEHLKEALNSTFLYGK